MDNYEHYAVMVIITFGALVLGGLMAAGIAAEEKGVFLCALGGSIAAWVSGHAVLFNRPRLYGGLILLAILLSAAAIWVLVN